MQRGMRHLRPLIEKRLEQYEADSTDKGNDLLTWLLQYAKPRYRTVRSLTCRILAMNFAATHSTSRAFTNCLYDLAAHPECVEPLREELKSVLETDSWNKVGMVKLRKLDSFIHESQRQNGSPSLGMPRRAMKDFTFSNGVTVPEGHYVAVATHATHMDAKNYSDPEEFQPFRFSDLREEEGESTKHQAASSGLDWLNFGGGRHSCPGRFLAVNKLKGMLAYVLLNYDVKLPDGQPRPKTVWMGHANLVDQKAHVLFRKRKGRPEASSFLE